MITLVSASMYWGGQRRERAHPEGLSRKLIFLWEEKEEDEELEKEAENHNCRRLATGDQQSKFSSQISISSLPIKKKKMLCKVQANSYKNTNS